MAGSLVRSRTLCGREPYVSRLAQGGLKIGLAWVRMSGYLLNSTRFTMLQASMVNALVQLQY